MPGPASLRHHLHHGASDGLFFDKARSVCNTCGRRLQPTPIKRRDRSGTCLHRKSFVSTKTKYQRNRTKLRCNACATLGLHRRGRWWGRHWLNYLGDTIGINEDHGTFQGRFFIFFLYIFFIFFFLPTPAPCLPEKWTPEDMGACASVEGHAPPAQYRRTVHQKHRDGI